MVERVADGSFGMVYKMQHKTSRMTVAAKRIKHRKPEDVFFSRKEVAILRKIKGGPNIISMIEYFESPAQSIIITELLEGRNMKL